MCKVTCVVKKLKGLIVNHNLYAIIYLFYPIKVRLSKQKQIKLDFKCMKLCCFYFYRKSVT